MPQLPNPEELQRVAPNAKSSVAGYRTGAYESAVADTGREMSQLAEVEINKLDDLKAADAETQLMRTELDLQTEYDKVKGGDVLKPDFHQGSKALYEARVSEIGSGLSTPAQKAKFQQLAQRRSVSFDARRTAYAMGEADRFEDVQYQSRVQAVTDTAAANYAKPDVVAASVLEMESAFTKRMISAGLTDPAILSTKLKELRGNFYSTLIDRALLENDTQSANAMYAASRGMLSDQQKQQLENRMRPANDFAEGQALAVEAQGMVAAGKSMADVEMYVAKKASSPGAYNATQTIFGNMQQANAKAQAEAQGSVLELYHNSGSNAAAKQKVLGSQEYARLTPEQRVHVIDYIEADVQQDKSQARADITFGQSQLSFKQSQADRLQRKLEVKAEDKFKTPEAMAKFYKAITDPALKDKSRAELYNLVPDIGYTNVQRLLGEHETLGKSEKPITLDADIVNAAMPANLKKNKQAAQVDAYQGIVKGALMDWQANNPGKRPSPEEQKAIARSANQEYTVSGTLWGTNTYKLYEEGPTGNKAGEAETKRGILQAAAARGRNLTPAEVNDAYLRWKKDHP